MTRVQILLSDDQNEQLAHLATRLKTTKSGLIREAVDMLLMQRVPDSSDPLLGLIGQAGKAGRPDISSDHNGFLNRKEKERWTVGGSL